MAKTQLAVSESADDLDGHVVSTKLREGTKLSMWEPPAAINTTRQPVAIPIEQEIIDVIVQPLAPGESHRAGNDRKERELSGLLALLTPAQSLAASKRLTSVIAGDPLSAAFGRVLVERRMRLLAGLSRRRAIAATQAQRPSRG